MNQVICEQQDLRPTYALNVPLSHNSKVQLFTQSLNVRADFCVAPF